MFFAMRTARIYVRFGSGAEAEVLPYDDHDRGGHAKDHVIEELDRIQIGEVVVEGQFYHGIEACRDHEIESIVAFKDARRRSLGAQYRLRVGFERERYPGDAV